MYMYHLHLSFLITKAKVFSETPLQIFLLVSLARTWSCGQPYLQGMLGKQRTGFSELA